MIVNGDAYADGVFNDSNSNSVTVNGNALTTCSSFPNQQPKYGSGGSGKVNQPISPDPSFPQPASPSAGPVSGNQNLNSNNSFSPEVTPTKYAGSLTISGGCFFFDPGVYEFTSNGGFSVAGGLATNVLSAPAVGSTGNLWTQAKSSYNIDCSMVGTVSSAGSSGGSLASGTSYAVELTSTRSGDNGYSRESAASGCFTVSGSTAYTITIPNVPGAEGYNVYAGTGGCSGGFTLQSSVTVSNRSSEREGAR